VEQIAYSFPVEQRVEHKRKLVVVVSSDRTFAESLRSHLAKEFDVLLARDGGEAASKAQMVTVDVALVDLGRPVLGISALDRMKNGISSPVICALVQPGSPSAQDQFDFDHVFARPRSGADIPDRVRFILAKSEKSRSSN
jgi:DNA-binding response OmpR family regulator